MKWFDICAECDLVILLTNFYLTTILSIIPTSGMKLRCFYFFCVNYWFIMWDDI
jgi:hypothetical protein